MPKTLVKTDRLKTNLSCEQNSATGLLDLLLGSLRNQLGLNNDGLGRVHNPLAQHLEVAQLGHVQHGCGAAAGCLLPDLLRDHGPEAFDVDDGAVELVAEAVEVAHADLAEVARMVLVEEDAVVVHTTGVSPPARMLAVLPDTAVPCGDVAALLPVLLEAGRHLLSVTGLGFL
ncbi:hypothetical protein RJ640_030232 [Escallonia rubra]|uniref:Uncharacterized protein n=1 Tax=Escallonia rubra TaxID=112253 RepID=A0AA88RPQ0_9ASTE|nr:hypothetical protein RJ640_030232 [Escallonia rubra]